MDNLDLLNLTITTHSKTSLISIISEYKNALNDLILENKTYQDLIHSQKESNEISHHKLIKKLTNQLEAANNNIENLKSKNIKLLIQNKSYLDKLETQNKIIQDMKQGSHLENLKSYINTLFSSRKFIPLIEIDNQRELSVDQKNIEINIIYSLKQMFMELYENLEDSTIEISHELSIIEDRLLDSRNRLSIYADQDEYLNIIKKMFEELTPIVELFKIKNKYITIGLSPYEKLLLRKEYIHECEKNSDILQRLIYNQRTDNNICPYILTNNIQYCHMFSSIKDVFLYTLIVPEAINHTNNISYIVTDDKDKFIILESLPETNTRNWIYDCYLLNTIRNINKKLLPIFVNEFRRFYKDCFGHNDYVIHFQTQLEMMNIKRWKQYKILYENIRILADEYMSGEILRDLIRTKCVYKQSKKYNDVIRGNMNGNIISDFKEARKCFNQGKPYIDEQEYYTDVFDNLRGFNEIEFSEQYQVRWKEFLKVYYK